MEIVGAVLERTDAPAPFAQSTPLTISRLDLDAPEPGEVLVRIEAAGVCHSDLSVVDGTRVRPTPMLLGHEASGIVEALGTPVPGLAVGDRVVMTFLPRCGACAGCATNGRLPCGRGSAANADGTLLGGGMRITRGGHPIAHHLGVSAFASHAVVHHGSLVQVDSDVPADIAALLGCAVLTGGGAVVNVARPEPGETVVIVGLGGVGLAAAMVAKALGNPVVGVDSLDRKRAASLECGVDQAYSPEEALGTGLKAPVVIEAAGNARAFETAVQLTAPGGRTVTVGLPSPDARSSISPLTLTAEARTIVGSYLGSSVPARDIPRFVSLWRDGKLPIDKLISARIGLDEVNEAMDALADGRALRQLIVFDSPERPAPDRDAHPSHSTRKAHTSDE